NPNMAERIYKLFSGDSKSDKTAFDSFEGLEEKLISIKNAENNKKLKRYVEDGGNELKIFIDKNFEKLRSMNCAQRQEILEFINKIIKDIQLPIVHTADEWINFSKQLDVFKMLCKMDFDIKPLYFAQKSIRYLNELKTFEESLINIIEKIHSNSNLKEILTI
ncbi:unnamed protein product, partial [Didymodactylos carnosus]